MKIAALVILAVPLALAACATQQTAQMLDAKVQRNVKGCIANGWMHDGVIARQHTDAQVRVVIARRKYGWPGVTGIYLPQAPPELPRIERRCR